ncbi:hypothetical protein Emag_004293 [Eimeria magna]
MACAEVIPIPTLSDNYAYLVIDKKTKAAACVDPAEPEKVIAAAKEHGVTLHKCLCTHKHFDHSGDLLVKVLHAPCHTSGHILYYMESRTDPNEQPIVFTGECDAAASAAARASLRQQQPHRDSSSSSNNNSSDSSRI